MYRVVIILVISIIGAAVRAFIFNPMPGKIIKVNHYCIPAVDFDPLPLHTYIHTCQTYMEWNGMVVQGIVHQDNNAILQVVWQSSFACLGFAGAMVGSSYFGEQLSCQLNIRRTQLHFCCFICLFVCLFFGVHFFMSMITVRWREYLTAEIHRDFFTSKVGDRVMCTV